MHILLIKMSSMGDIIHTLPALTDAQNAIPNLKVDWVLEPGFADIARMHPGIHAIIPTPFRKWRKNPIQGIKSPEFKSFISHVRHTKYDIILDAQGLLKSAFVSRLVKQGVRHGLNYHSAREPLSSLFYKKRHTVNRKNYAISRTRELFAKSLGYDIPTTKPQFNITLNTLPKLPFEPAKKYLVFLHSTTWDTKHYPISYWKKLLEKAQKSGYTVYLPWGNETEKKRADDLASDHTHAIVLPKLSISTLGTLIYQAHAVVAVDTGLCHLSVALETPTVVLYGPTDPNLVGIVSEYAHLLTPNFHCAPCSKRQCLLEKAQQKPVTPPCFSTVPPKIVWDKIQQVIL